MADGFYSYYPSRPNYDYPEDDLYVPEPTTHWHSYGEQTWPGRPWEAYSEAPGDPNLDPFYLEDSLAYTDPWTSHDPYDHDPAYSDDYYEFYSLQGSVETEFEQDHRFAQCLAHQAADTYPEQRQSSASSLEIATVPNLSPSSSVTSRHSATGRPVAALESTERASHSQQKGYSGNGCCCCLPPGPSHQFLPSGMPAESSARGILAPPGGSPAVYPKDNTMVCSRQPMKPCPSTPTALRGYSSWRPSHRHGRRSLIELQMGSLDHLVDRATYESHEFLFDRGPFSCPDDSSRLRPATAPSASHTSRAVASGSELKFTQLDSAPESPIERSVWEPDSDSESEEPSSPKLLSSKSIETLRRVRSKLQLRVAKSGMSHDSAIREEEEERTGKSQPDQDNSSNNDNTTDAQQVTRAERVTEMNSNQEVPWLRIQQRFPDPCSLQLLPQSHTRYGNRHGGPDNSSTPVIVIESEGETPWTWHYQTQLPDTQEGKESEAPYCHSSNMRNSIALSRPSRFHRFMRPLRGLNCYGV